MKFQGETLQQRLRQQRETVTLIDIDGQERRGISARYAADSIVGRPFIGHGKNGIVTCIRATEAPRRGPFATTFDMKAIMRSFPRLLRAAEKTPQDPGAKQWVPQPVFSNTGSTGAIDTVHLAWYQRQARRLSARFRHPEFSRQQPSKYGGRSVDLS